MDINGLEFPRHVHKPSVPGRWVYRVVHDVRECEAALAEGWSLTPILIDAVPEPVPPPLPAPAKRKPGRPPKVRV